MATCLLLVVAALGLRTSAQRPLLHQSEVSRTSSGPYRRNVGFLANPLGIMENTLQKKAKYDDWYSRGKVLFVPMVMEEKSTVRVTEKFTPIEDILCFKETTSVSSKNVKRHNYINDMKMFVNKAPLSKEEEADSKLIYYELGNGQLKNMSSRIEGRTQTQNLTSPILNGNSLMDINSQSVFIEVPREKTGKNSMFKSLQNNRNLQNPKRNSNNKRNSFIDRNRGSTNFPNKPFTWERGEDKLLDDGINKKLIQSNSEKMASFKDDQYDQIDDDKFDDANTNNLAHQSHNPEQQASGNMELNTKNLPLTNSEKLIPKDNNYDNIENDETENKKRVSFIPEKNLVKNSFESYAGDDELENKKNVQIVVNKPEKDVLQDNLDDIGMDSNFLEKDDKKQNIFMHRLGTNPDALDSISAVNINKKNQQFSNPEKPALKDPYDSFIGNKVINNENIALESTNKNDEHKEHAGAGEIIRKGAVSESNSNIVNLTVAMKNLFNDLRPPTNVCITNNSFMDKDGTFKFSVQICDNSVPYTSFKEPLSVDTRLKKELPTQVVNDAVKEKVTIKNKIESKQNLVEDSFIPAVKKDFQVSYHKPYNGIWLSNDDDVSIKKLEDTNMLGSLEWNSKHSKQLRSLSDDKNKSKNSHVENIETINVEPQDMSYQPKTVNWNSFEPLAAAKLFLTKGDLNKNLPDSRKLCPFQPILIEDDPGIVNIKMKPISFSNNDNLIQGYSKLRSGQPNNNCDFSVNRFSQQNLMGKTQRN